LTQTPEILLQYGYALFYTGNYKGALNILDHYYTSLPDNGKILNLYGNLYLACNNIVEAQKYYYAALKIEPDNEEYALNLADSFIKLQDYENAYKITKQIVKKEAFDRAKSLHLRIKAHLFHTLSCAKCKREWSFPKKIKAITFPEDHLTDLPPQAPAGTCPRCGKTFCRSCVAGVPGIDTECPECQTILEFENSSLKIIGNIYLKKEEIND
jgi:tetratricopeptide (TPR) repeat protein